MENIIDHTYFIGQINVPFDNTSATGFETEYIKPYQREILLRLLGYDLYRRLEQGYQSGTPSIWVDLVEGKEYTVDVQGVEHLVKWNGLKNIDKVSLIAYYVYFKWLRQNNEQLTGTGVSKADKENATDYEKDFKLVAAWNMANDLAGAFYNDPLQASLFNFLKNHKADYEPIVFNMMNQMNPLGI